MTTASGSESAPSLILPASEQVSAGATVDATGISYSDSVAAANPGAMYLRVTATEGTLSALDLSGAAVSGSGSGSLTLSGSYADVNHALASLAYTAGAAGGSDTISFDLWNQDGVETTGSLPVTISSGTGSGGDGGTGGTGPTLTEPASETVAPGGTVAVSGSYFDTYGPNHPGSMYVEAIVKNGTVQATDTAGNPVAGSGTSAIRLNTDYATINAVLHSLTYTAGPNPGSDSIYMEVWNQLGTVRIDTIPVTITTGGGSGGGGGAGGSGGTGGTGGGSPSLTEPSSETMAAGATQAVSGSYSDSFAAANAGTMYLSITAGSGTLKATDAAGHAVTGSGTHSITLSTDYADVNAILHSLTYTAGTGAAADTINFDVWNQAGVETTGTTSVAISGGGTAGSGGSGSGGSTPMLSIPASATASAGSSVAVEGSYADSFAQGNPGAMYISISDSNGTLSATDAAGHTVAGSGSNTITAQTDFVDVNAILASLHYTAPGSAGSDTIHFDLWNQAGVETTGATTLSINPSSVAAAMTQASSAMSTDFAAPKAGGSTAPTTSDTGTQSSTAMLSGIGNQPVGMPLPLPH